jgi:methionyl-tRNA formyltransferase
MRSELHDVAFLAADTTRSRAYLQNMARRGLTPAHVIIFDAASEPMPGQAVAPVAAMPAHLEGDAIWAAGSFDPNTRLRDDVYAMGVPVSRVACADINDARIVEAIAARSERTMIYSGYGGQILRTAALSATENFLHVHGGWVPAFKGSTCNYYDMIENDQIGASAIFLTSDLDGGPLLKRMRFPVPHDRTKLDHLHDSAARAIVLCDVLEEYRRTGAWPCLPVGVEEISQTYFVIHPVLKHIAIFGET